MWHCGLCAHVDDEATEPVPWAQLPDDWVCPICGAPMSSFVPLQAQSDTPPADPSPCPADDPCARYQCDLCSHIYDEAREGVRWDDLPDDWVCPVCGSGKASFIPITSPALTPAAGTAPSPAATRDDYLAEWHRPDDDLEQHMADIHRMAVTGHALIEPMRTRVPSFSWDDVLVKGAQLATLPLNKSQPVTTRTILGPGAALPLGTRDRPEPLPSRAPPRERHSSPYPARTFIRGLATVIIERRTVREVSY